MLTKITVSHQDKTIPNGFELLLDKMTVITGENNTGKTNFVRMVADGKHIQFTDENDNPVHPKTVYIAADNIKPSDNETKATAASANLITNLANLFTTLGRQFNLDGSEEIVADINLLIDKANDNLSQFTKSGLHQHGLTVKMNEEGLDSKVVIQALVDNITGTEDGQTMKLEDLGQGTQRVVVASMLKAYKDVLLEKSVEPDVPVVILFEEPEVYLHPRLKRALNATLEAIAGEEGFQVIITTHDAYFAFQNLGEANKKLVSFKKVNGVTEVHEDVVDGIEDELLFVFLFNLLKARQISVAGVAINGFVARDYRWDDGHIQAPQYPPLEYIRHQIHHLGDNQYTDGLISDALANHTGRNYYTEDDLRNAIVAMSQLLA